MESLTPPIKDGGYDPEIVPFLAELSQKGVMLNYSSLGLPTLNGLLSLMTGEVAT